MPKVKLYLILGGFLIAGVGVFLFINSTNRYQGDTTPKQTGLEESSQIEEEGKLPSAFPKDFPIYPEANLESVHQSKGREMNAISAIWLVPGTLNEVSSFYKRELISSGRKVGATFEDENSVTMSYKLGQEEGFIGLGVQENGLVIISVTIGASFKEPSI